MTELEKLFAGITRIGDYNIDMDFDNDEITQLLDADIIKAADISQWRASDLLIDGIIDYEQYPFEKFSAYEQIRQLKYCAISPADFRKKADFDVFDADEWLFMLEVLPDFAENAPWGQLRKNGSVKSWMELLKSRPDLAEAADWNILAEKAKLEDLFDLAEFAPMLYKHFVNKEQMLKADSALWVKLLARRPELIQYYPMENLDEADEVEFLLLHQPQLVKHVPRDESDPPVKLFIINPSPEDPGVIRPEMVCYISSAISAKLFPVLEKILFYQKNDAEKQANMIGYYPETFAGIYPKKTAVYIMEEFEKCMKELKLDLAIRMEDILL